MKEIDSRQIYNIIKMLPINVSLKDVLEVTRFRSEEYNRDYNVYKVETSTAIFVLKRTTENEARIYNLLKKLTLDITPKLYCSVIIDGDYWICMEYINSSSADLDKIKATVLIKKLALLHCGYAQLMGENMNESAAETDSYLFKIVECLVDSKFHEEELNVICFAVNNLIKCSHTLIHDDMIPLNTVCTEESIKVIDWEHSKIAPYTMDLGRFLGDLNVDKPWINPEWEQDLLSSYQEECLSKGNASLDLSNFYRDYYSAKLMNHVKVITAYKTKNLIEDEWYKINRRYLCYVIKTLGQFQ